MRATIKKYKELWNAKSVDSWYISRFLEMNGMFFVESINDIEIMKRRKRIRHGKVVYINHLAEERGLCGKIESGFNFKDKFYGEYLKYKL